MRVQRNKIRSGRKRIRGLKVRVEQKAALTEGADEPGSTVVYKLDDSEKEVTVLVCVESQEEAGRAAPGVTAT